MAGDWIKMRTSLPRDPRVVRITSALHADKMRTDCGQVSALHADRLRTVGGLLSAWCLFDELTEDGRLDGYTPELLDEMVGLPGLTRAMESVGWVEIGPEYLMIPRFSEHNGRSAKRRAQESVRKMSARDADKHPHEMRTKSGPEKRREEKSIIEREQCAGEEPEPEPDLPEAEIPSLDEVIRYGSMTGCSEEMCRKFFAHYDGNNLWSNQHGKPIKWRIKLVGWRSREHEHKPNAANGERQGTVSESVAIIRDTKALERAEARRKQIREKYDMHMDWNLEDRKEDRQLREQIEILKKQLGFAA